MLTDRHTDGQTDPHVEMRNASKQARVSNKIHPEWLNMRFLPIFP